MADHLPLDPVMLGEALTAADPRPTRRRRRNRWRRTGGTAYAAWHREYFSLQAHGVTIQFTHNYRGIWVRVLDRRGAEVCWAEGWLPAELAEMAIAIFEAQQPQLPAGMRPGRPQPRRVPEYRIKPAKRGREA
jgi:hypothetical protein